MEVGVVGTGYVGLVSGTCFADLGWRVTCVDTDAAKLARLEAGDIPIFEPGLEALVAKNTKAGRLRFTGSLADTVKRAEVLFIAVGTPPRDDGTADLSAVEAVAREVGRNLDGYRVLVTKSTVPAGTGAQVRAWVEEEAGKGADFDVVSNPEFLREGSAIEDFMRPDRVVVGTESGHASQVMRDLYKPLTSRGAPLLVTDVETAEVIKYASNAFLATKITFINQVADLCEKVGADVKQVAKGMGLDNRIGRAFLNPGPGYGGSCFPKDTQAFAALARTRGAPLGLVEATIEGNDNHQKLCLDKVLERLGDEPRGKRVGVLGLSFKPDTDDMRESPSLVILPGLLEAGVKIRAFDPEAMEAAGPMLPEVELVDSVDAAAEEADLLLILTEWNQFRVLEWDELRSRMAGNTVVDLRNMFEPGEVAAAGLRYCCVGRTEAFPPGT